MGGNINPITCEIAVISLIAVCSIPMIKGDDLGSPTKISKGNELEDDHVSTGYLSGMEKAEVGHRRQRQILHKGMPVLIHDSFISAKILSSPFRMYKYFVCGNNKYSNAPAALVNSTCSNCKIISVQTKAKTASINAENIWRPGNSYGVTLTTNGAPALPIDKCSSNFFLVLCLRSGNKLCCLKLADGTNRKHVSVKVTTSAPHTEYLAGSIVTRLIYALSIFQSGCNGILPVIVILTVMPVVRMKYIINFLY